MKPGDLIQYVTPHGTRVLGIIIDDLGFFEEYNEKAVRVHWFDNHGPTVEKLGELLDPEYEDIEFINEAE